jgi:tetratricopeptide (TPR) repeat protein
MSEEYFKNEIEKIEQLVINTEKEFVESLRGTFDKINKDIQNNEQKNKFKLKVETEQKLDLISKKFNDIHSLEIKRREMMLKKLKQEQAKTNEKFKQNLKSFREKLFSEERNNLSDKSSINNFLKEMISIEQQIVKAKNEDAYNIIMDDFSQYQLSAKYYHSSALAKIFLKNISNNFKLIESTGNYPDLLEFIDGMISLSDKIVEKKAYILHKNAMILFSEKKYNEAQKNLENAINIIKDDKLKLTLQYELDKVKITNMHTSTKNFKNADFEEAIKICDRLLESPFLKDKNKEKIKMIKNLDLKKYEQFKNKNNNNVTNNPIHEEVNEIDYELGEE